MKILLLAFATVLLLVTASTFAYSPDIRKSLPTIGLIAFGLVAYYAVYMSVASAERMRKAAMWVVHLNFILETGTWTIISLAMDGDAWRHPLRVLKGLARLRKSPFTRPQTVRQLFQYHQRNFHPNDRDTTALIADWRQTLFGPEGDLTEALAS